MVWLRVQGGGDDGAFYRKKGSGPRADADDVAPSRDSDQITRQREARRAAWAALIDGDDISSKADLARHLGVSRARVTQVLGPGPVEANADLLDSGAEEEVRDDEG